MSNNLEISPEQQLAEAGIEIGPDDHRTMQQILSERQMGVAEKVTTSEVSIVIPSAAKHRQRRGELPYFVK